jgi:hypothetical protein
VVADLVIETYQSLRASFRTHRQRLLSHLLNQRAKQYNLNYCWRIQSDLLQVKSLLEPVLEYYGVSAYEDNRGIVIDDADDLDEVRS